MKMAVSEKIRAFRKERGLTQEQLAEALQVTVGAVYKWEAGLSLPELPTLVEMADFFDASVDALLGYEKQDDRRQQAIERLKRYLHEKDPDGLAQAEKLLRKYPNDFAIVYNSARLYRLLGLESGQPAGQLHRALQLFERARLLLGQNDDPQIDEGVLVGEMASALLSLGRAEKAVELLKSSNAGGRYDDQIGLTLASDCRRPQEALPFLAQALLRQTAVISRVVLGYVNVYAARQDAVQTQAILEWGIAALSGLRDGEKPCFLDKLLASFETLLADAQLQQDGGDTARARQTLLRAGGTARRFDSAPSHRAGALRFVPESEPYGIYDDLGTTGLQGIQKTVTELGHPALTALWEEVQAQ